MELPTFKEFDPNEYSANRANRDWLGRRLGRHLTVTAQVVNTPAGERQWSVRCGLCRGAYVLTDAQIENPRTIICRCR
jgi:hypothetical protein